MYQISNSTNYLDLRNNHPIATVQLALTQRQCNQLLYTSRYSKPHRLHPRKHSSPAIIPNNLSLQQDYTRGTQLA